MKSSLIGFFLLAASGAASAQLYNISTVAGIGLSPGLSGDGGPAASAQFRNPQRVAVDQAGNLYIGDYANYSVRKVAANGNVSTLAGNGSLGFAGDGGAGASAQLSTVHDVVVDGAGNLYIADTLNNRVRMVNAAGTISTYAGSGTRGYAGDGGAATAASLYFPAGLALDAAGNLYIADSGNAAVRKVDRNGNISTIAGVGYAVFGAAPGDGGPATKAYLEMPYSLGVNAAGEVFVGDIGTSTLRKVGVDGKIATIASNFPAQNFVLDATGTIYFTDSRTNTVQKILPGGTRIWIAGDGTSGYTGDGAQGTAAQLAQPYGVAVDAAGAVYVADAGNSVIRKLTPVPFSVGAVANAATIQAFAPPSSGSGDSSLAISPGEIVVLFGLGIGPATLTVATPANGAFPTVVGGTSVNINGVKAPVVYTSSAVTAAIVPYSVYGLNSAQISVAYQGKTSGFITVPIAQTAPGVFTADASGAGQAAALNQNLTLNSAANPAKMGDVIVLYATGEGQTSPGGVDGKIAGSAPLPQPLQRVNVLIGGQTATVQYAGAAPTLVAGVMQINVQVPTGIATGTTVPVQVQVGGVTSPQVYIAVAAAQ